jgi:serine O-acetyltransferase
MLCSLIYHVLYKIVQVITGIELPCEMVVGRNFVIDHFGGIIISGYGKFGDNCRIRDGVVVGLRRVGEKFAPVVGNDIDLGSGAKLLGPITIGDKVLIGANAVVMLWYCATFQTIPLPWASRQLLNLAGCMVQPQ